MTAYREAFALLLGVGVGQVDLRLEAKVDRPLLCDLARKIDLPMTAVIGGKESKRSLRIVEEWRFIDVLRVLQKDREEYSRRFLKAFKTDDGAVADPEFNGVTLQFANDGKQTRFEVADRRAIHRKTVDRFLAQSSSVGWHVALPSAARVGEECDVALLRFLRALVDSDAELECAPVRMKLVAVDDATRLARLEGPVDFSDTWEPASLGKVHVRYHASARLEVDLAARRLASIAVSGIAQLEGDENVELRGEGPFEATLTVREGAVVEKAALEKPEYRLVEHKPEGSDVSFLLPSYWFEGTEEEGEVPYVRGIDFAEGGARIAVMSRPGKLVAKVWSAGFLAANPGAEVKPGSGPLGETVSFTLSKDGITIVGDTHPVGEDRRLTFRLILPSPIAAEEPLTEFQAARKTLKRLPKE